MNLTGDAYWLPVIFAGLMGLSLLMYAMLDGFDLGVGILLPGDDESQRDVMISSIGPFWDANETWLVMGVGVLLIAFPLAHSTILHYLYLPVALLLLGLILRGVAFDFRAKAHVEQKQRWDWAFKGGSLLATLSQGYMLGLFVMGFESSLAAYGFAVLSAVCVSAGYCFIGASWLIMKTEGDLQVRAVSWARRSAWLMALGLVAVSVVNPLISDLVYQRWLGQGSRMILLIIPALVGALFIWAERYLRLLPMKDDAGCWIPFAAAAGIFVLSFLALGYSFFPYLVPEQIDIWEAASATESLWFILYGVIVVVPTIFLYTLFAYRVFWGKTRELSYH